MIGVTPSQRARRCLGAAIGLVGTWAVLTALALVHQPVALVSGSMAPALERGDLVLTAPAAPRAIEPGDVVVRDDAATPVVHRVVRIERSGSEHLLWTKGDANPEADASPYTAAASVRRVEGSIPGAGSLLAAMRSGGGRLLFVLGVAALGALVTSLLGRRRPEPGTTRRAGVVA